MALNTVPDPPVMDPQEEKEALMLLKKRNLLYLIGEHIQRLGVAGEKRNALIIYLCVSSRILKNPLSLLI
jgi:hypothetical protein